MKNQLNICGFLRKIILLIALSFVLSPNLIVHGHTVAETVGIPQTYAQQTNSNGDICGGNTTSSTTQDPTKPKDPLVSLIQMIIILEKLLLGLNIPLVWVIGKLMSNDWVYLDGQMANILGSLWLIVRNFVNILFAAILIFIAFKTVVGGGSEKTNFAVRTVLPKFVIALVLVNFSLLIGKLILDAGNLATTASFSIVSSVQGDVFGNLNSNNQRSWFCTGTDNHTCLAKTYFVGIGVDGKKEICSGQTPNVTSLNGGPDDPQYRNSGDSFVIAPSKDRITTFDGALFNARDAMYVYSYNIFHLADIMKIFDQVNPNNVNLQDLTGIMMNVVLAVVMAGFLILINIAMLIAFAVRMVMIWILLIFSPIMAVDIVFTGATKRIPILKNGFLNTFLTLSFMPAIAGFILSMGFIMYTVLNSQVIKGSNELTIGGVSVYIAGNLLPGFNNLQQFILSLVMMVIMWSAIFFMFKSSSIIEKATNSIQNFGKGIAKAGGEGLKSIPFFPTPSGAVSIATIGKTLDRGTQYIRDQQEDKTDEFLRRSPYTSFLAHEKTSPEMNAKIDTLIGQLKTASQIDPKYRSDIIEALQSGIAKMTPDRRNGLLDILAKEKPFKDVANKLKSDPNNRDSLDTLTRLMKDNWPGQNIPSFTPKGESGTTTPPAGETTTPTVTVTAPTSNTFEIKAGGKTINIIKQDAEKWINGGAGDVPNNIKDVLSADQLQQVHDKLYEIVKAPPKNP